jgi:hypothetical protein
MVTGHPSLRWLDRVFPVKPRTLMSSIMRARNAVTGRWEGWEVIGGSSLKPLLDLRCSGSDAPIVALYCSRPSTAAQMHRPRRASSHESGFVLGARRAVTTVKAEWPRRAESEHFAFGRAVRGRRRA